MTARIGSLCTGYGGLDMAARAVLGGTVAWHCENDPDASRVLTHHWPNIPNHGDLTEVDWATVEPVDVMTMGFPCQDLSHAGKRAGIKPGNRSGLWFWCAYAISQVRPELVIIENVRGILSGKADRDLEPDDADMGEGPADPVRALGVVLGDLADLGYDTQWTSLRAADAGACHGRSRVFIVAQDTDRAASGQRRQPAPRQTERRRSRTDTGRRDRTPPADADEPGPQGRADAGRGERTHDGEGQRGEIGPVLSGDVDWGAYTAAIRRWEYTLSRPAPAPTERGRTGPRLSPAFVEWMQGLPAGHVTDVPSLTRNAQLRILGNGVVPQQATAALRVLLHGWSMEQNTSGVLLPTVGAA